MKNELVDYMVKLQNMADFLARGYALEGTDEQSAIEIVTDEKVENGKLFSLHKFDYYNKLKEVYYGEQESIGVLMHYISCGQYERQVEALVDFEEEYIPPKEEAEFYYNVMKRVKKVLKTMALGLIFGTEILLDDYGYYSLQECYLEDDDDLNEESSYIDDLEGESDVELEEPDFETGKGILKYEVEKGNFYVVNLDKKVIIPSIHFEIGMEFYNQFLERMEKEELYKTIEEPFNPEQEEPER